MRKRLAAFLLSVGIGLSSLSGGEGGSKAWTTGGPKGQGFWSLTARGKVLFVGSNRGLYKSTTRGNRWELSLATTLPWIDQRVTSVTIDPANPSIVFATLDSYKPLFKSTDGGESWRAITAGLVLPSRYDGRISHISSLAIDPLHSDVVYAGTTGTDFNFLLGAIMKSSDGGESWQQTPTPLRTGCVVDLEIDPEDGTLYALTGPCWFNAFNSEMFKTTDAGTTWTRITAGLPGDRPCDCPGSYRPPAFSTLVIDPADHLTLYIATTEHGLYRSRDAGGTWQPVNAGLPRRAGFSTYPIVEALSWGQDGALYAGLNPYGLFKSTDGGDHWLPLNFGSAITGLSVVIPAEGGNDREHRGGQLIYVEGLWGIYQSADDGNSWSDASDSITGSEVSALVTDPTMPGVIYAGTRSFPLANDQDAGDGRWTPPDPSRPGVFRSVDRGRTWTRTGSPAGRVISLAVDSRTGHVYASMSGGALFKSEDHGMTWKDLHWQFFPEILAIAIDSERSIIYVGTSGFGVLKTEDDGKSWFWEENDLNVVSSLAMDPLDPDIIFAGTNYGVYKTIDGGATWAQMNNGLTFQGGFLQDISRVVIDPSDSQVIYAGATWTGDPETGGVFKSDDGGMIWRPASDGLPIDASRIVRDVAIDPRDSHSLYLATFGGVFQSQGEETSWQPMDDEFGLRTNRVLLDPLPPGTLYAGTDYGVFTLEPLPDTKPSTAKRTPKQGRPSVPSLDSCQAAVRRGERR